MGRSLMFLILVLSVTCLAGEQGKSTPVCSSDQVEFVYTPCDNNDNTWRVQIPTDSCQIPTPAKPIRGVKCSLTCQPGEYLNITTQNCSKCKPGYYSLGDGKRLSNWNTFPPGFKSRGFSEVGSFTKRHKSGLDDPCYHAGWKLKGSYIESDGSSCRSVLKFENELISPGNISFTFKSSSDNALLHVWVEKKGCSSNYNNLGSSKDNDDTENYYTPTRDWQTEMLALKKGRNTLYFVASHYTNVEDVKGANNEKSEMENTVTAFESQAENTVQMKDLVVRGYGYSLECDKCEGGTMSGVGASSCDVCGANTFSEQGSDRCLQCPATKYSAAGSQKCEIRKPCTKDDYYEYWEPCKGDKTRKSYKWKEPQICAINHSNSVKLPTPGKYVKCPGCNPGFYNNGTGACLVCPKNEFSPNGEGACQKCPPQTRSVPKLHFKNWRKFPGDTMHLYCLARPDNGCKSGIGWTLHDDYISSGLGHADDAELLMYIIVPGFTASKSTFKMTFSIICPSNNCRLRLQTVESANMIQDIRKIDGGVKKQTITHTRHSPKKTRYRITFEKKYNPNLQTFKYTDSSLHIHEIEVSNVKGGGAEKCESCEDNQQNCITCDPGFYIGNGKCIKCPKNTYSTGFDNIVGIESCLKCPTFTFSEPGSTYCYSNCFISINSGDAATAQIFNLTGLAGEHVVSAPQRFTTKGYNYHHSYFISICGQPYKESRCLNNATEKSEVSSISGAICRTTIIPDDKKLLSAQPLNVGKVITTIQVANASAPKNNTVSHSEDGNITFIFYSKRYTEVCTNGTAARVTLLCDQTKTGEGKLVIGDSECDQETCNGCLYHFSWRTVHACARCTQNDYKIIKGGCKNGKKTIHYVWKENRNCIEGVEKPKDTLEECSIFEKSILDFKLVILGFLLAGVFLAIIVIILCYRNRSLSYKYSRLIDASQTKDGELPAAETCAYEEGEEDDEVILTRSKGRTPKILDRLKGLGKQKNDFSEFETINLDSIKNLSGEDDDDEL